MEDSITINGFTYSVDIATVLSVDEGITSLDGMQRGVRYIGKDAFAGCENLRIVRIPETVIRIEDYAFSDCPNIIELHLPRDMEYISPLAFTLSKAISNRYYGDFRLYFPKDSFLKYVYMIPQFLSEWDYEEYGLTDEDMERVEGWTKEDGLPNKINLAEFYRVLFVDFAAERYPADVQSSFNLDDEAGVVDRIYHAVMHEVFEKGYCTSLEEIELTKASGISLLKQIREDADELLKNSICRCFYPLNERPIELTYIAMHTALDEGCTNATGLEVWQFEEAGIDLNINCADVLESFFTHYISNGYLINVELLKCIVRQSLTMHFHIGYSYGVKYKRKRQSEKELDLFTLEDMRGGISIDFFDKYEDAYLEAMRIVGRMSDKDFYGLSHEYEQKKTPFGEMYFLKALPHQVLSQIQFSALGEIINLRHFHNNELYGLNHPHIMVPLSYNKARKRFVEECKNTEVSNNVIKWIYVIDI